MCSVVCCVLCPGMLVRILKTCISARPNIHALPIRQPPSTPSMLPMVPGTRAEPRTLPPSLPSQHFVISYPLGHHHHDGTTNGGPQAS